VFRRVLGLLGLLSIPMMVLMAIYSHEIAQLAFQRRACGEECIDQIAPPLLFYAFALWPAFASLLLNRTLSAANRQNAILWTTVATVAITIVLDILLLGPLEQAGLALAATLGVYANAAMLMVRLRHHYPAVGVRGLAGRQGRLLVAGALAALAALGSDLVLPTDDMGSLELLPALVVKLAVAVAVYVAAAWVLAREELDEGRRSVVALVTRGR
jgi:putative peptidoglycan lipid II flippase